MKKLIIIALLALTGIVCEARNVTIHAVDMPAAEVFRSIVEQTGMNFVYSSDLLKDMHVTVDVTDKPLKKALSAMFKDSGITYTVKGRNIILKRKERPTARIETTTRPTVAVEVPTATAPVMLEDVVVVSRLEAPAVETAEIGARKITAAEIANTPVLFGESDVIKALHTQPGVIEGNEGMAGMYVHGGNADENLYMLDNVPLYQVNHFAGLFSAFNTDIIRYIDFFKTSVPAKYDGRLSSFMDVRLQNGRPEGHHGSARLGLTSGAFNISGPIGGRTSYLFGLRRSWYDVLTIPFLALINSQSDDEKIRFRYYFMDVNAKISHRFLSNLNGFVSAYFGDDLLKTGSDDARGWNNWGETDHYDMHWGNLVVQAGLNYRFSESMTSEFTAAYTRYFSSMKSRYTYTEAQDETSNETQTAAKSDNNINDWIMRGDFDWTPAEGQRIRFGAGYIRHNFLPGRATRQYTFNGNTAVRTDSLWRYGANELNAYAEDDWRLSDLLHANIGLHASMFNIDGKTHYGLSPRVSLSWRVNDRVAVKGAYARTVQYVHQLTQSYLALPTDRWVPITGSFKPQTADKISLGGYWQSRDGIFVASVEGYYKWMHNLLEYRDEYYLTSPLDMWSAQLTAGSGTAKGIDFKFEKVSGKVTGHISYSLAWADRLFAEKNGGRPYPARYDNRHTINIVVGWNINSRVRLNAAWTGHSGNRFTLMPQMWQSPDFFRIYNDDYEPLRTPLNNYQLPFYHRLDLSCTVNNSRGYWTFGLYNAYCHLNTIAITRGYKETIERTPEGVKYTTVPVFQKVKLLPIIPSISYTWLF